MSIQGVGANQKYVGVPISLDQKKEAFPKVPFECHRCNEMVDSEKGYYVEHYRVKIDRYGGPKRILCAASNNKVRAELRTLEVAGECDQCGIEVELKMTEEYPGGLLKYGGFLDVPCTVCDGNKHATCEECGQSLHEVETKDPTLGVTVSHWVHDGDSKPECDNAGEQFFVFDYNNTDPATGTYVKVAGPFPVQADAVQEQDNLENAPTASGNENYGVNSEVVAGTNAKAFAPSIKQNPAAIVRVHDGFTIEERDDDTSESPFDLTDPITAALMGNTDAQEG